MGGWVGGWMGYRYLGLGVVEHLVDSFGVEGAFACLGVGLAPHSGKDVEHGTVEAVASVFVHDCLGWVGGWVSYVYTEG